MVAIGALHDPLDFVAVEVPSRRALGHEIPEGLHAYHRIDHLLDGFRRLVQRHGGHLKQQSGLAGDTFEIRQVSSSTRFSACVPILCTSWAAAR